MHSGVRWLCEDGHICRPGEIIAYCNLAMEANDGMLFYDEFRDLQAAFATRVGGRLRISPTSSRGGFMDQMHYSYVWRPDFTLGHIEADPAMGVRDDGPQDEVRLVVMAGRRMSELAEIRSGLLSGWHSRSRAWSGENDHRRGTLLSVGVCEQMGVIRGEHGAFLELFEASQGPAQAVYWPGEPLVQTGRILLEQLQRAPADQQAIAEDIAHTFPSAAAPDPAEWIFMGALLSSLGQKPIGEPYPVVKRTGISATPPADAILLSLNAESNFLLRHKRLGYHIRCHNFRFHQAGKNVLNWMRDNFDNVWRTYDDILADYIALIDAIRRAHPEGAGPAILIMNEMSSAGMEDIYSYAGFDRPMGDTLAVVRAKELNLLLHDLAATRDISIVDSDAIAADLGGWAHITDGVHQSGPMQAELRAEILHILNTRQEADAGPLRAPSQASA